MFLCDTCRKLSCSGVRLTCIRTVFSWERIVTLLIDKSYSFLLSALILLYQIRPGADPGFDQGGAQIVTGLNCRRCTAALCERSEPFSAWGSSGSSWVFHY